MKFHYKINRNVISHMPGNLEFQLLVKLFMFTLLIASEHFLQESVFSALHGFIITYFITILMLLIGSPVTFRIVTRKLEAVSSKQLRTLINKLEK